MENNNSKVPEKNQDGQGLPPNTPPPPSSVIPLNNKGIEEIVSGLEKVSESIEKTNELLVEKKAIEEKSPTPSQEDTKRLSDIEEKIKEQISIQNDVLSEVKDTKEIVIDADNQKIDVNSTEADATAATEKIEIAKILKKENDVLSSLNENILELKTLQESVKEILVKESQTIDSNISPTKTDDVSIGDAVGDADEKSKDGFNISAVPPANISKDKNQQLIERLDKLYVVNAAEYMLMKDLLVETDESNKSDVENKIEETNKEEAKERSKSQVFKKYNEEMLDAEEKTASEVEKLRLHFVKDSWIWKAIKGILAAVLVWALSVAAFFTSGAFLGGMTAYITLWTVNVTKAIAAVLGKLGPIGETIVGIGEIIWYLIEGPLMGIINRISGFFLSIQKFFSTGAKVNFLLSLFKLPLTGLFSWVFRFQYLIMGFAKAFSFVSKFFLPLQILLSVIDGVIGAIKGFTKMGLKGAIMGAIAQIISGLTLGLIDFTTIFDFFNKYMGDIFDGLTSVLEPIIQVWKDFYGYLSDAFFNIIKIFSGNGSFLGKLWESIVIVLGLVWKLLLSSITNLVKLTFAVLIKLPFKIIVWVFKTLKMINDAIIEGLAWLWNYITSGEMLKDLANFGLWLGEKLKEFWITTLDEIAYFGDWLADLLFSFFDQVIDGLADALGELPFVGDSIKKFLGGGSDFKKPPEEDVSKQLTDSQDESKEVEEKTQTSIEKLATTMTGFGSQISGAVKSLVGGDDITNMMTSMGSKLKEIMDAEDAAVIPITTNGKQISKPGTEYVASEKIKSMARDASQKTQQNNSSMVSINSPTTISNSGSPQPMVLTPSDSRNTEPTYRALMMGSEGML